MYKFFDYLSPDLPTPAIRDLLGYIRRFAALFGAGGVGGFAAEALIRAGVGALDVQRRRAGGGPDGRRIVLRHPAARRQRPRPLGAGRPPAHPRGRGGVSKKRRASGFPVTLLFEYDLQSSCRIIRNVVTFRRQIPSSLCQVSRPTMPSAAMPLAA